MQKEEMEQQPKKRKINVREMYVTTFTRNYHFRFNLANEYLIWPEPLRPDEKCTHVIDIHDVFSPNIRERNPCAAAIIAA